MNFQKMFRVFSVSIGAVVAVLIVAGAIYAFWANTRVDVDLNHEVHTRRIYILMDYTGSIGPASPEVADIVVKRIFPQLGPGDQVSGFKISTTFLENENRVFGDPMLPGIPKALLSPDSVAEAPKEYLAGLWLRADEVKNQWSKQVYSLNPEKGGFSDYLTALSYVGRRIHSDEEGARSETIVVVLGDLFHEPKPNPFVPPKPDQDETNIFAGVDVHLVSLFRAPKPGTPNAQELEKFWTDFFGDRGNTSVRISPFYGSTLLVPPNSLPHADTNGTHSKNAGRF